MAKIQLIVKNVNVQAGRGIVEDGAIALADDKHLTVLNIPQTYHQYMDFFGLFAIRGKIDIGVCPTHHLLQVAMAGTVHLESQRANNAQDQSGLGTGI
jgi:hypothetical protein